LELYSATINSDVVFNIDHMKVSSVSERLSLSCQHTYKTCLSMSSLLTLQICHLTNIFFSLCL